MPSAPRRSPQWDWATIDLGQWSCPWRSNDQLTSLGGSAKAVYGRSTHRRASFRNDTIGERSEPGSGAPALGELEQPAVTIIGASECPLQDRIMRLTASERTRQSPSGESTLSNIPSEGGPARAQRRGLLGEGVRGSRGLVLATNAGSASPSSIIRMCRGGGNRVSAVMTSAELAAGVGSDSRSYGPAMNGALAAESLVILKAIVRRASTKTSASMKWSSHTASGDHSSQLTSGEKQRSDPMSYRRPRATATARARGR
jgi:hypothetical protein